MTFLQTLFAFAGSCALLCALSLLLLQLLKQRRRGWHNLVADLYRLDMVELSAVALDYLTPCSNKREDLEPNEIWEFLGGYRGLRKMRDNADVLLALAAYAQRWNFDEAVIVTERMRIDAASLRRAVRSVELGLIPSKFLKHYRFTLPLHAQKASSSYYLMRQRLLVLYQTSHAGLYATLAASL